MPYPFDATLKEILSLRPEDCPACCATVTRPARLAPTKTPRAGCLKDAKQHLETIKYYFDNAGEGGYSQANPYYSKLVKCYSKGSVKEPGIAHVLHELHAEAVRLMDAMKVREKGTPDGADTSEAQ